MGIIDAALAYAARGWYIFPCRPGMKVPLTNHGVKDATTDPDTIRAWWTQWPDANIALACGPASGIYVVDVDLDPEKGVNGWESLREFQDLPETIQQNSPRGGAHFLFKSNNPPRNKNSFRPGIDIRSTGYYIMLSPSIHPNGKVYEWERDHAPGEIEPAEFPDYMRPTEAEKPILPWDRRPPKPESPRQPVKSAPGDTRILERASSYLRECAPAIQGMAGHDALLWAARAMVVGFDLSDATALDLLWREFNPRCSPPWNQNDPAERKDFERKVAEVRKTPGQNPRGWLLDECGLRSQDSDEATLNYGRKLAAGLLAGYNAKTAGVEAQPAPVLDASIGTLPTTIPARPLAEISTPDLRHFQAALGLELSRRNSRSWTPFPVECFPPLVKNYVVNVAKAHCVDESFVALPVLVGAAAAMGNAYRLVLKDCFNVPPTLWAAIVAKTGTNKSGPLKDVLSPLQRLPLPTRGSELLAPIGRLVIGDATTEAVVALLSESPRGLLLFNDELAAWVLSFNAYRKQGGADEQFWLKTWDAAQHHYDRKTNNEHLTIPAAAVSIIGGIQPAILAKSFSQVQHASGLVPRLNPVNPPERDIYWTDDTISAEAQEEWARVVDTLRTTPFMGFDTPNGVYQPNIISLSSEAKRVYVKAFDEISATIKGAEESYREFASKSRLTVARLALIFHGLKQASERTTLNCPVVANTMDAAVEAGRWFLNEQLRVWEQAKGVFIEKRSDDVRIWIEGRGGKTSVRDLQNNHTSRYRNRDEARADLDLLVQQGLGSWDGNVFVLGKPIE